MALLNAILQRLGFDAQPALVSLQRNRGIADYLPGHDQFDHVITRLQLDDKVYWLDPTLQKQGRRLDTRGHPDYGMVLMVAPQTQALARMESPPGAPEGMEFDQTWDLSDLTRAAQFTSIVRAAWPGCRVVAQCRGRRRHRRIAENMAGAWARVMPGLKATAAPLVRDDRETNSSSSSFATSCPESASTSAARSPSRPRRWKSSTRWSARARRGATCPGCTTRRARCASACASSRRGAFSRGRRRRKR